MTSSDSVDSYQFDLEVDPQKLSDMRRSILFLFHCFGCCIFHPLQVCATFSCLAFSRRAFSASRFSYHVCRLQSEILLQVNFCIGVLFACRNIAAFFGTVTIVYRYLSL